MKCSTATILFMCTSLLVFSGVINTVPLMPGKVALQKSGKGCLMTRVHQHEGTLSDKYAFHFTGNPVCTYIPGEVDEQAVANGKPITLRFFVPLAGIKSGSGKQAVEKLNSAKCKPGYCVKVRTVSAPTKGIQYDITLRLDKCGLEYQSFTSITGERGIMFKFHNQEALKKVNVTTEANRIRRLAYGKKPKIVVDYAHGGKDPGYISGNLREKDINFAIGSAVSSLLKKKGYDVCLTRQCDEYLALSDRTKRAQSCYGADALISIHTNAAPQQTVSGIETFCTQEKLFTTRLQHGGESLVKAAEQVDRIMIARSNQLAQAIHANVLGYAKQKNRSVVDRKIKHKVAQLLIGSEMPSVLLELGFLTNPYEAKLLQDKSYQKLLAQGICRGLDEFFNVM